MCVCVCVCVHCVCVCVHVCVCVCVFGWSFNFDIITYFHSLPCTLRWKVDILFYHSLSSTRHIIHIIYHVQWKVLFYHHLSPHIFTSCKRMHHLCKSSL